MDFTFPFDQPIWAVILTAFILFAVAMSFTIARRLSSLSRVTAALCFAPDTSELLQTVSKAWPRVAITKFIQVPLLHHRPASLSPFPYAVSFKPLPFGHFVVTELLSFFIYLSLAAFTFVSLALCHILHPFALVFKHILAKMLGSQLVKAIQECVLVLANVLSHLPSLMNTIYITTYYIFSTVIPNAFYEYYNPILSKFGLAKKKPKPAETTKIDLKTTTHTPTRIIHDSDDLTIINNDLTRFFSAPRVDIVRYRAPFTSLSPEKRGRVYHDHAKPSVFSTDYELAEAEHHTKEHKKQGETIKGKDEEVYFRGKFAMTNNPDTHMGCKATPKTANMAKMIQAHNDKKGKSFKKSGILKHRDLRTRQILFTYNTGSFLLTKNSNLKNVTCTLEDQETEKGDDAMELYFIDMEGDSDTGVDIDMADEAAIEGLPFADFDDVFDAQGQKPIKDKTNKQEKKAKKDKKKEEKLLAAQSKTSDNQPAKANGKKGQKKLPKAPTQTALTKEERDALDDACLDEDLSSKVNEPGAATTSPVHSEPLVAPAAPILSQADIDGMDDDEFLNEEPVPEASKPSAVTALAEGMDMDQTSSAVEITQATNTVNSYPAGPMEDLVDGDSHSIQLPTVTENANDGAMEQAPNGDVNVPNHDGDITMQDSDTESIRNSTPSLINDSASEDDGDDDDDEADASFVTHFPTPDAVEHALDLCNDNVETMSNPGDESLFTDLSICFSHLSLKASKPITPPEAFRVTKASNRQTGMPPHSFIKSRADKKDQEKVENEKPSRPLKSKAPEKKPKSLKKDKTVPKLPRTPISPNKALYLASAIRTASPKSKVQNMKEKVLLDLATQSDKKLQTMDANMETHRVKIMDLADSMN